MGEVAEGPGDSQGSLRDRLEGLSEDELREIVLAKRREWYLSPAGYLDFVRDSGAAPDAVYQPHGRYCQILIEPSFDEHGTLKHKLTLWPRGSYKSQVFNVGQAPWQIAKNPNMRILVCSETERQAKLFVRDSMRIIESEWYRELFGNHVGKDWSMSTAQFTSALREQRKKEPTLTATGMGKVQTGMHWDMIIFDDVCSQENTKTADSIQKIYDWFGETMAQLDPGCPAFMIGTLHHYQDLYCHIMATPALRDMFDISKFGWCDPLIDPTSKEETELFFPEKVDGTPVLSREFVARQKATLPDRLFACFYENRPQSGDRQLFKPEYFRVVPDSEIPRNCWTYILTDFAFTSDEKKKGQADRTVFWVVALDASRTAYVLDLYIGRWKPSDSIRILCKLWDSYREWNVKGVTIEKVGHREMLSSLLQEIRRESFTRPRLIEIEGRSQEVKDLRIEAIEPTFRNADIYFSQSVRNEYHSKWEPMFTEMTQWPLSAHDDVPDAISDLHKRDKDGRYYLPEPPPGWRPQAAVRYHPAIVDGNYNPMALPGFPEDKKHKDDIWSQSARGPRSMPLPRKPRKPFG
jgi:predicted phage terminase large subunit-like protein